MTQLLEDPTRHRSSTRDPDLLHWVCVRVNDHPMIGLCGELTNGNRRKNRTATRDICAVCLDLARTHCAGCPPCAPWLDKYR